MAVNVADRAVSDVNRSSFQDKGGVLAREGRGEGGAKGLWIEEAKSFRYTSCRRDDSHDWSKTFLFDPLAYVYGHTGDQRLGRYIQMGLTATLSNGIKGHGKIMTQQTRAMPFILYELERGGLKLGQKKD